MVGRVYWEITRLVELEFALEEFALVRVGVAVDGVLLGSFNHNHGFIVDKQLRTERGWGNLGGDGLGPLGLDAASAAVDQQVARLAIPHPI